MTRVKICGITCLEDACLAERLGVWAIGEVFAPSARRIEVEDAVGLNRELGEEIFKIGVFVDDALEEVNRIAELCGLDMVQLHGHESPEYVAEISKPVIKAIRVSGPISYHEVTQFKAKAYLFDTVADGMAGGTGVSFNWQWLEEVKGIKNLILAGGLNPDNIEKAIEKVKPWAIDVSSGVEMFPGKKDPVKMTLLAEKVKVVDGYVS